MVMLPLAGGDTDPCPPGVGAAAQPMITAPPRTDPASSRLGVIENGWTFRAGCNRNDPTTLVENGFPTPRQVVHEERGDALGSPVPTPSHMADDSPTFTGVAVAQAPNNTTITATSRLTSCSSRRPSLRLRCSAARVKDARAATKLRAATCLTESMVRPRARLSAR